MNNIILESQHTLLSLLQKINTDSNLVTSIMADIYTLNIWNLCYNPRNLSFIDIIKGIIPIELTSFILRFITHRNIVYAVLSNFLNFVYNSFIDKI